MAAWSQKWDINCGNYKQSIEETQPAEVTHEQLRESQRILPRRAAAATAGGRVTTTQDTDYESFASTFQTGADEVCGCLAAASNAEVRGVCVISRNNNRMKG
eukprot:CAMPEP_0117684920 /NCGR_PEP_ID=MMETSP0804-20121206/21422_1 /TAXON_ID=1074897 /ORGANISM="Tetraselmis astigmatica, Strain CCMP880" /LENGTH=101 /DNA_ID=CAMNT_0005496075 /DNA_START=840 /DNA_END=1145 /DNA_ORIENTATION=-